MAFGSSLIVWFLMVALALGYSESAKPLSSGGDGDDPKVLASDLILSNVLRLKRSLQQSGWTGDRFSPVSNPLLRQLNNAGATTGASSATGQRVRLVGGSGPWEGMVEVYTAGGWRGVTAQQWSSTEANVVCRQLGYVSYFSSSPGLLHSDGNHIDGSDSAFQLSHCGTGLESSLLRCQLASDNRLESQPHVGVVCLTSEDLSSRCSEGELPFGENCYQFSEQAETRLKAEWTCRQRGANLVAITSQLQHDFLSGVMEVRGFADLHTSGRGYYLKHGAVAWEWQGHKDKSFSLNKWGPGGDQTAAGSPDKQRCLTLQSARQPDGSQYSLWADSDCSSRLPFVCQRPYSRSDCASGYAGQYAGNISTAESGSPCLRWSAVANVKGLVSNKLPDNLCRNPDGDRAPWCFTSLETYEFCDVPACPPLQPAPEATSGENCGRLEFSCGGGTRGCVPLRYLCDGDRDCNNGRDEELCDALDASFQTIPRKELVLNFENPNKIATRLSGFKRRPCQAACLIDPSCRVSYSLGDTCILFTLPLNELTLRSSLIDSVSVVLSRQPRCDGFLCDDLSCVNKTTARCDRQTDCKDLSDEINCPVPVDVRLVDGADASVGRLEARVNGRWGAVCHDLFKVTEGTVVCRQLGFQRLKRFLVGGRGSPARDDQHYSVSLSKCDRNATSFGQCLLVQEEGRCIQGEHITLECTNATGSCTFFRNSMECSDYSKCLADTAICNGKNDCEDGSDESGDFCPVTRYMMTAGPPPQLVIGKKPGSFSVNISSKYISDDAADFLCRQLGGGAEFGVASEDAAPLPLYEKTGSIYCSGRALNLTCRLEHRSPLGEERALRLQCLQQPPPPVQLRLETSGSPGTGLLELQPPLGRWGRVCAHSFNALQAKVACRQLGFSGPADFEERPRSGGTNITLRVMDCQGEEEGVGQCLHHPWTEDPSMQACDGGGEVLLRCGDSEQPTTPSQVTPSCQASSGGPERVLGGDGVLPGQQPWYVQVQYARGADRVWKLKCGGSLISARFVLTVQHCLRDTRIGRDDNGKNIVISKPLSAERLRVVARNNANQVALRTYLHRAHRLVAQFHNDIALIELRQPLELSPEVKPVCLPPPGVSYSSDLSCSIAGLGKTGSGRFSLLAKTLQVAEVTLFTREQCTQWYNRQNITQGMVCAGSDTFDVDACDGDSGGPLTCRLGTGHVIMGITSWGEGCGLKDKPGVYTRVASYVRWIVQTISSAEVA